MITITCPRCSGSGKLPKFSHVENGVCFLCDGKKTIEARDLRLPEKTVVCYQDNRRFTEFAGETFPVSARIERFSIVVNGGSNWKDGWEFVTPVTESNRVELREIWKAAKAAGCECKAFH